MDFKKSATKFFHRKIKIYDDGQKKKEIKRKKHKKNLFIGFKKNLIKGIGTVWIPRVGRENRVEAVLECYRRLEAVLQ